MTKRVVLAPAQDVARGTGTVTVSRDSHPHFPISLFEAHREPDLCSAVNLTEPEALALRDWLCAEFGLPRVDK